MNDEDEETTYHKDIDGNLILDPETGEPIPSDECICAAWDAYECVCGAWPFHPYEPYDYDL